MRFNDKPKHNYGDTRIVEQFLLFPYVIKDETRWLEKGRWKQVYREGCGEGLGSVGSGWRSVCWLNEDYKEES